MVVFDDSFVSTIASCSSEALQLGLLVCERRVIRRSVVRQYSFQHLTVQEFLVAYLLSEQIDSEETLKKKLGELGMGPHQFVVLQFLAGLLPTDLPPTRPARLFPARFVPTRFLPPSLLSIFFAFLNKFLHDHWDMDSQMCEDRLRMCLHCAREAYNKTGTFPANLHLPKQISLYQVSAADLELLSASIETRPSSTEELVLFFTNIKGDEEEKKFGTTHGHLAIV